MKKILLSIFTILTIGVSVNAQTKIYDFPFDSSLSATVGSGTFVSSGSSFSTDRDGNENKSLSLTEEAIATLNDLPIGNSERTVSLWIKVFGPDVPIFPVNIARYGVFNGAGTFGVYLDQQSDFVFQSGDEDYYLNNNLQLITWTHLLYSLSNDSVISVYINGNLDSTFNKTLNTLLGGFALGGPGLTIHVDDLKIYNGALTASQVTEVYTNNDLTTTSVNDVVNANILVIYPNPTSTITTLSGLSNGQTLQVMDVMGKVVYQTIVTDTSMELDVTDFTNGLYIIQVEQNGAIAQKKLVVNK